MTKTLLIAPETQVATRGISRGRRKIEEAVLKINKTSGGINVGMRWSLNGYPRSLWLHLENNNKFNVDSVLAP